MRSSDDCPNRDNLDAPASNQRLKLTATSLRGLFQRKLWGWNAIFCARIVGVAIGVLGLKGADRSAHALGETLVALYILFQFFQIYILFQVRSLYTV